MGETEITAEPTVLTPLPGGPINHHWTKDLALSPDGETLYVSVGSNSNAAERGIEAEKGRAAIWQVDRETGAARVYASGLRNPNGLTFHPDTGTLFTVVNERDELGSNLVPDYMTSVEDGGFYGWPWSYYGDHVDERVHPPRPEMVEQAIAPDYALSSHVAALGLTFSMGSALPEEYASGAFIGEHGSWNRTFFNGYKVVYVPFENGEPAGMAQDVVTGFLDGENARGRPVGVGIDGTGALLIADDAGNTVWRVAAADGSVTPEPLGTDRVSLAQTDETRATRPSRSSPATRTPRPRPTSAPPTTRPRTDTAADAAEVSSDTAPTEGSRRLHRRAPDRRGARPFPRGRDRRRDAAVPDGDRPGHAPRNRGAVSALAPASRAGANAGATAPRLPARESGLAIRPPRPDTAHPCASLHESRGDAEPSASCASGFQ